MAGSSAVPTPDLARVVGELRRSQTMLAEAQKLGRIGSWQMGVDFAQGDHIGRPFPVRDLSRTGRVEEA